MDRVSHTAGLVGWEALEARRSCSLRRARPSWRLGGVYGGYRAERKCLPGGGGAGIGRRWRVGGCGGPCLAEAEPLAEIVEAEGIGQGRAGETGAGGVVGVDGLIDDPAGDEEAEDTVDVAGQADEDGEDEEVDDPLAY